MGSKDGDRNETAYENKTWAVQCLIFIYNHVFSLFAKGFNSLCGCVSVEYLFHIPSKQSAHQQIFRLMEIFFSIPFYGFFYSSHRAEWYYFCDREYVFLCSFIDSSLWIPGISFCLLLKVLESKVVDWFWTYSRYYSIYFLSDVNGHNFTNVITGLFYCFPRGFYF